MIFAVYITELSLIGQFKSLLNPTRRVLLKFIFVNSRSKLCTESRSPV